MDGYVSNPIRYRILRAEVDGFADSIEDKHMTQSNLQRQRVNTQELLERVDNDRELLAELLCIFKVDFPANLQELRAAVCRGDLEQITRFSHTLKGTLANLAATTPAACALRVEQFARNGDLENVKTAFSELEKSAEGLVAEFESHLAQVQSL